MLPPDHIAPSLHNARRTRDGPAGPYVVVLSRRLSLGALGANLPSSSWPRTNPLLAIATSTSSSTRCSTRPRCTALPAFAEHSRETFDLYLQSARRLAREVLFPAYRAMDEPPPRSRTAACACTRDARALAAARRARRDRRDAPRRGRRAALPLTVAALAHAYLMAAQPERRTATPASRTGAAHLIEAFGERRAASASIMTPHVRRRVDRHHGAHRAAGRLQPRRRDDHARRRRRDGTTCIRGSEDLHLRRRPRPHREHRPPDARAHRGRAAGHQGRVALRGAASGGSRAARSSTTTSHVAGRHPQDRLARPAQPRAQLRRARRLPRLARRRAAPGHRATCSR